MKTLKLKPLDLFVPISRVDESERIVEGYAFVNEVVPGEGGMRLKRSAMEAATPDYMRWANIREMHRASAVGTAEAAVWDDKGLFIRAKVVDDDAWKKVRERVYKGFSVGVQATVMRGKDVEACTFIETSLVDRPKDVDAVLTVRAEGVEVECEIERASFADYMASCEPGRMRDMALDWLWNSLWDIQNTEDGDKAALVAETCDEFKVFMVAVVEKAELTEQERSVAASFVRLDQFPEHTETLTRLETANNRIAELETELGALQRSINESAEREATAKAEIERLKKLASPEKPPMRFIAGQPRPELQRQLESSDTSKDEIESLQAELEELTSSTNRGESPAIRVLAIQRRLAELGVAS